MDRTFTWTRAGGDFACRISALKGYRVIGVDFVPERLQRVSARGIEVIDLSEHEEDLGDVIREMTEGRGPDSVLDAVDMEAHGSPATSMAQKAVGLLPPALAAPIQEKAGVDRLNALYSAIDIVRRGGTISLSGVYGGTKTIPFRCRPVRQADPGQDGPVQYQALGSHIMPLLTVDDPLGVDTFATHRLPLEDAPDAYRAFQEKRDGHVKVQLQPWR